MVKTIYSCVISIVQLVPAIGQFNWTQWRKLNAYNIIKIPTAFKKPLSHKRRRKYFTDSANNIIKRDQSHLDVIFCITLLYLN